MPSPRPRSGVVEAMRALSIARRSAVKAKTQAINQLRALLSHRSGNGIRASLWKAKPDQCVARCIALKSLGANRRCLRALTSTLRLLAKRWTELGQRIARTRRSNSHAIRAAAPRLLAQFGVGPQTAATLLVTAGDNPNAPAQRGRIGRVMRREPFRGLLRKDKPPSPEPRRRSRRQQCAMDDLNGPDAKRRSHARIRRQAHA